MIGVVFDGATRVACDLQEPVRHPGEALVELSLAGICDTDLQLSKGYMGFSGVPGHEFVGRVLEADDARWRGQRVVADINAGCGTCDDCRDRRGHHCRTRTVLGIVGRQGAFAERLAIPERCLVAVPDSVSDRSAVFAEPLAAALHVLEQLPERGVRAATVVLGDGKLGQLIARALAWAGEPVTLVGRHEHKLGLARAQGIATCFEHEAAARLGGAAVVVEATGSASGLALAFALCRARGTVILKTTIAGGAPVDLAPAVVNELTIRGSRCGDMAAAVAALAQRGIDPEPLIEASYPLIEAEAALAHAFRRGALKVLLARA